MLKREWIGGFISGEGCFTFAGVTPLFSITLSKKDIDILLEIQKTLPMVKVACGINAMLWVYGTKKALKLIKLLDNYILGDKLIDYNNWKMGVNFILSKPKKEKLSKQDKEFIYGLQPSQNKKRKIFTKKDLIKHVRILRICDTCKLSFYSNSGKDIFCNKCKLKRRKEYNYNYQKIFRKENPNYFRDCQRKKFNIPKERWRKQVCSGKKII